MTDDLLGRAFPHEHRWPDLTDDSWTPRVTPNPIPVTLGPRHLLSAFVDCLADACRWVATRVRSRANG